MPVGCSRMVQISGFLETNGGVACLIDCIIEPPGLSTNPCNQTMHFTFAVVLLLPFKASEIVSKLFGFLDLLQTNHAGGRQHTGIQRISESLVTLARRR